MESSQASISAVLAIQLLTLIFQFIHSVIQQIGKNKLDQIHAINTKQTEKLEEIHKQNSDKGSNA